MKRGFLILGLLVISTAFAEQAGFSQAPTTTVKVIGCLQGDGSDEKPWLLSGVAIPAPPTPAPAGGGGGGAGRGGRGGGGGAPGGADAGAGAPAAGGGRGGRGGAAPAAPAPPPPPPPVPLVDLRLTGGMNMSIWRGMKIEVEGTLGARPATGLREFRAASARSVQGICTPK
jgi:hypothetical protein